MGEQEENFSRIVPGRERMTAEAFARRPRRLGWIEQWRDGEVWCRPAALLAVCRRPLGGEPAGDGRCPSPADLESLLVPDVAAFLETIEGWGMSAAALAQEGRQSLSRFFEGARGEPSRHSRMAVRDGRVVGGALLTEGRGRRPTPLVLDALFVDPAWQGCGVARDLLWAACISAGRGGWTELYSMYDPGNERSAAWHGAVGFVDVPDLTLAEARLAHLRAEEARLASLGETPSPLAEARGAALEAEVADLRARGQAEGWAAVSGVQRLYAS